MPGRNQTGPAGQGPMTGRKMGVCGGRGNGAGRGIGIGRGVGRGRGRGHGFGGFQSAMPVNGMDASSGKEALEQRIALLRSELEKMESALSETKDTQ